MPLPMLFDRPWPAERPPEGAPRRDGASALVGAVAAIVAVAAERARVNGELGTLRDALERVLDAAAPPPPDPRDAAGPELPPIADIDAAQEAARLRALMIRGRSG